MYSPTIKAQKNKLFACCFKFGNSDKTSECYIWTKAGQLSLDHLTDKIRLILPILLIVRILAISFLTILKALALCLPVRQVKATSATNSSIFLAQNKSPTKICHHFCNLPLFLIQVDKESKPHVLLVNKLDKKSWKNVHNTGLVTPHLGIKFKSINVLTCQTLQE